VKISKEGIITKGNVPATIINGEVVKREPAEPKPFGRIEMAEARHAAAVTALFDELRELLDQHDRRDDDDIPVYQWLQQISNQISKAQSGKGPMRDRYITIAEMALAAMLSISRNKE
jgi:hypothetical protein